MRIGRTIIDTDNMTTEELDIIIRELRGIRARKLKAEELKSRMVELIADAKENGFTYQLAKQMYLDNKEFNIYTGECRDRV